MFGAASSAAGALVTFLGWHSGVLWEHVPLRWLRADVIGTVVIGIAGMVLPTLLLTRQRTAAQIVAFVISALALGTYVLLRFGS